MRASSFLTKQVANSQKRDPLKPSSAKVQGSLQEAKWIESEGDEGCWVVL